MTTQHLFYTISHRTDGWHAGPAGGLLERTFASKQEALLWCKSQAQQESMNPLSSFASDEAEVEIRGGD